MSGWSATRNKAGVGAVPTHNPRRELLRRSGALVALAAGGALCVREARAADEALAFDSATLQEALHALGQMPQANREIVLTVPDLVENGAVVPVSVDCRLPGTSEIYIVVEANPNPIAARFTIPEGTESFVSTRIKVAESGPVCVVVRAGGKLYAVSKTTQVVIGGCA